ncbi:glycosyltransferase family 4 protein [Variovorax sp. RCC_210]|uniref:glycosyltransferase family 4 protein n=1 Tax=Variovorax sp. RCC_210 TaxID=3239217 RepID=UPI003525E303
MTVDTVGGVWNHALELSLGLVGRGMRVSLATMGAPLSSGQRAQVADLPRGLTLHESAWRLEWMEDPWHDVQRAGEWLLSLAHALRPDLVHLNQFAFGALAFPAPTLLVAHSCVMSWWRAVHGEAAPASWNCYRDAVRRGLGGAGLVAAPTHAMREALAFEHGAWLAKRALVLPNGRSAVCFAPGNKEPAILSAGRLWDKAKNLAALAAVASRLPWPVCVAGATEKPGSPGLVDTGALAHGVRSLGELTQQELAARLAKATVYALPARYEPFGQSVLEAALSGCALVLGDLASLRELWGDAALYVAPDDHAALHAALVRLIDDAPLRQCLGARALARARFFTPDRMVDAYLGAYARLAGTCSLGATPSDNDSKEKECAS